MDALRLAKKLSVLGRIYALGLLNEDEQTQKEIAKQLHISRSYVSRIEKRALAKVLREFIKNNKSL